MLFVIFSCLFSYLESILILPTSTWFYRSVLEEKASFREIDTSKYPQAKNCFLNLNNVAISLPPSDLAMTIPGMTYDSTLFNYNKELNFCFFKLNDGECIVTSNTGYNLGTEITINAFSGDHFQFKVVGIAPSFTGYDNYYKHNSIILLANNDSISSLMLKPAYVNFLSPGDVTSYPPTNRRFLSSLSKDNQRNIFINLIIFGGVYLLSYVLMLLFFFKPLKEEIRSDYLNGLRRDNLYLKILFNAFWLTQAMSFLTALLLSLQNLSSLSFYAFWGLLPSLVLFLLLAIFSLLFKKRCLK